MSIAIFGSIALLAIIIDVILCDCCRQPLGLEKGTIQDRQMTSSSAYQDDHEQFGAQRARLHWHGGFRANHSSATSEIEFLRVDLNRTVIIAAIATQGYSDEQVAEWVTRYTIVYAHDGEFLHIMDGTRKPKVFVGNSDSHSVQYHGLSHPVTTSVVLLRPKEWHNNIGLRLELYGCLPGYYFVVELILRGQMFNVRHLDRRSIEYRRAARQAESEVQELLRDVPGYLSAEVRALSPQVSLSQSDVAAEIIIYCMYADLQRMITKLSMGIQREKDTIFDASHLQLSYPLDCSCRPPVVHVHLNKTMERAKVVSMSQEYFTSDADVTVDCNKTNEIFYSWEIARVSADSGYFSMLFRVMRPRLKLRTKSFGEGYLYVRRVSSMRVEGLTSYDYGFIRIVPAALIAVIQGPTRVVSNVEHVILNASSSYDSAMKPLGPEGISFSWNCWEEGARRLSRDPSAVLPHEESICAGNGSVLVIPAGKLMRGATYAFVVTIKKDRRTANATHVLQMDGFTLQLRCQKNCGRKISLQRPFALAVHCSNCGQEHFRYNWWFYAPGNDSGDMTWVNLERLGANITNGTEKATLFIQRPRGLLVWLTGNTFKTRVEVHYGNSSVFAKEKIFTVNTPPQPKEEGKAVNGCTISPTEGNALTDDFFLSCEGWIDDDVPLTYEFRYKFIGSSVVISSGPDSSARAVLPLGDSANDFLLKFEVEIRDAFGDPTTHLMEAKLRPPAVSRGLVTLVINAEKDIDRLVQDGNLSRAADMACAVLSLINANEELEEQAMVKGKILHSIAQGEVRNFAQTTKVAAITAIATNNTESLEPKMQDDGLTLIQKSLDFIGRGKKAETLSETKEVDETLLVGLGNVLSKSSDDARFDAAGGSRPGSRNLVDRGMLLQARIGDDLLEDAASCENPEVVVTKFINITVCRDDPRPDKRQILQQGEHKIYFPPMKDLFKDQNISSLEFIDLKVSSFKKNPYTWDMSYKKVKSSVLEVMIKDSNGSIMEISNLSNPNVLIISNPSRRDDSKEEPKPRQHYFVKPYWEEKWMRFHIIYIPSGGLSASINISTAENTPLDVYVMYNQRPTFEKYAYKVTLPNTSSCVAIGEGVKCASNPHSFDINSNTTGHTGRHFIGIVYSRTNLLSRKIRRSLCQESGGRHRRGACINVKDPPTPLPLEQHIPPEFNASTDVNYTLSVSLGACLYWNGRISKWTSEGCKLLLDQYQVKGKVSCACDHLSAFGGDFFVAPNPIDFDKVLTEFAQLGQTGNYVVLTTVCTLIGLYVIGIIFARRADKKDIDKVVPNVFLSDGSENPKYLYKLSIQTGAWKECGTTANIGIVLYGENGCTNPICLTPPGVQKTFFARGSINTFSLHVEMSLGTLFKIKIWHDDSGPNSSWFLHDVVITDPRTDAKWHFLANRWLALERGRGRLVANLKAAAKNDLRSFKSIFYSRGAKNLGEAHLYLSLFTKPPQSTFTRCQRLTCCLSILFSAMLVNAMFYRSDGDHSDSFAVGPVVLSWTQIKIGIQSGLIAVPVNVLVVAIFRNIKTPIAKDTGRNLSKLWKTEAGLLTDVTEEKAPGCFPPIFVYFAWCVSILVALTSAAFIVFYSLMWGKDTSNRWLTSVMISFFQDVIVIQPIKVVGLVVLLSLIFRKPLAHDTIQAAQKKKQTGRLGNRSGKVSPPSEEELEKIRCYRVNRSKMVKVMVDIGFFVLFVLLLMIVCYGNRDPSRYGLTKSVLDVFHKFDKISSQSDPDAFWTWINSILIPGLYDATWYNDQKFKYKEGFISNREQFLLGMPLLRQLRIKPDTSCKIEKPEEHLAQTFSRCLPQYSSKTEDTTPYHSPGWIPVHNTSRLRYLFQLNRLCPEPWRYKAPEEIGSRSFTGGRNTFAGGGYVAVLGYNSLTASKATADLSKNNWIDDRTAAVFVEFNMYEPSTSFFNSLKYVYERFPSGGRSTVVKSRTLTLYSHADPRFQLFYKTCHLIFMIVMLLSFAVEFSRMCRQRGAYFKQFWNWCNLILLLSTISSTVMFFFKEYFTSRFVKKVQENPFKTWSMDSIILWADLEDYLLSFVIFLVTLKMLALLRFNPHIVQMRTTLHLASTHLLSFGAVYVVMVLAYVQLGTLLFGSTVASCSSFFQSLRTVLQMMIGGKAPFFKMQITDSVLGPLFVFIYTMSMIWVLLSMFVAILNDSYTDSREMGLDHLEDIKLANFMKQELKDGCRNLKLTIGSLFCWRDSRGKYRVCEPDGEITSGHESLKERDLNTCLSNSRAPMLLASLETLDGETQVASEEIEATEEERTVGEVREILADLAEDLRATLPRLDYSSSFARHRWSVLSGSQEDWTRYSCSSLIAEYQAPREGSTELGQSVHTDVSDSSSHSLGN